MTAFSIVSRRPEHQNNGHLKPLTKAVLATMDSGGAVRCEVPDLEEGYRLRHRVDNSVRRLGYRLRSRYVRQEGAIYLWADRPGH